MCIRLQDSLQQRRITRVPILRLETRISLPYMAHTLTLQRMTTTTLQIPKHILILMQASYILTTLHTTAPDVFIRIHSNRLKTFIPEQEQIYTVVLVICSIYSFPCSLFSLTLAINASFKNQQTWKPPKDVWIHSFHCMLLKEWNGLSFHTPTRRSTLSCTCKPMQCWSQK